MRQQMKSACLFSYITRLASKFYQGHLLKLVWLKEKQICMVAARKTSEGVLPHSKGV